MRVGGIRGKLHFKHKTTYFLIYSSLGTDNNTDPYWIFLIPSASWNWFGYVQPFIFNDKERKECVKGLEKSDRSDILLKYGFGQSEGSESFLSHICSSLSFL